MNIQTHIRSALTAGVMGLCFCLPCEAAPVEIGDSRQEVEEQLGRPQGIAQGGEIDVWMYPRGEIEFQGDRVTGVKWMAESDYQAKLQGIRTQALQRKQAEEATARAQKRQAGTRKKEILADSEYADMTAAEQVAVWDEYYKAFPNAEQSDAQLEAQTALEQEVQTAKESEADPAELSAEEDQPRLSGSKKRKARRGAGKLKPEDRPRYMTRQTLNVKAREEQPRYLSGQKVRIPAKQENPSYLSGQSVNIKSPSKNPSFLSDQDAY